MSEFKTARNMSDVEYKEFNKEMNRLSNIQWKGYAKTLKEIGISYLGAVGHSAKMAHSVEHHFDTYCVYLSAYNLSGLQVCNEQYSKNCKENCLVSSGQYRLSEHAKENKVKKSRNTKSRLFFANRDVFMRLFCYELEKYKKIAEKNGNLFSVRINATSDLSPELFIVPDTDQNIIQYYNDVQFYDYCKVIPRIEKLHNKYPNYFMVYSYDGSQMSKEFALKYLEMGGHVAVVFATTKTGNLPKKWCGYDVCNGDLYDYRPIDPAPICGLAFKITATSVKNGKFTMPNTDFIVKLDSPDCVK